MAESNSTEQNTTENQGFVIPQANEATQQATTAVTQTAQAVGIPTIQEQTGSRDLAIGAVLAAVNPAKFLSLTILAPLGVVALVSAFLSFKSSQA